LGNITAIWYLVSPLASLVAIWYISPVLVYCVEINLATQYYILTVRKGKVSTLAKIEQLNLTFEIEMQDKIFLVWEHTQSDHWHNYYSETGN
jgi:hypothetical protein